MKKFLKRITLFLILYLIIGQVISAFLPYHWGNHWYSTKIQYLEKDNNYQAYNTYFFGSSLVYRQINPDLFDKVVRENTKLKLSAFNLGAPATFCPQNYFLLENFLTSRLSSNAKYCFVELRNIDGIGSPLLHQERTTYWQNPKDILFVVKSQINKNSQIHEKGYVISRYLLSYLEKLFHLGHFNMQISDRNYYNSHYLGSTRNGFLPLEEDMKTTTVKITRENLIDRKNDLNRQPEKLTKRINEIKDAYKEVKREYDEVHLNRINELISEFSKKGIKLIFIMSPRYADSNLIALSRQIDQQHIMNFTEPEKYPFLYEIENSFDVGHLNSKGANKYTEVLTKHFLKLQGVI